MPTNEAKHITFYRFMNVINSSRLATLFLICATTFLFGCATSMKLTDNTVPQIETTPLTLKSDRANVTRHGPNQFEVKCNNVQAVAVKQRHPTWCWAACAEMLFRYNGVEITQEEVVEAINKQTKPGEDPQSADEFEIWLAMNPEVMQEMAQREAAWGHTAHVNADFSNLNDVFGLFSNPSSDELVQELSAGNPLVMGLRGGEWGTGHIVLVYGVEYSRLNISGAAEYRDLTQVVNRYISKFAINRVFIVDPQPDEGKSQLTELNVADLKDHVDFTLGKAEAHSQLDNYMKVFMPTPDQMSRSSKKL